MAGQKRIVQFQEKSFLDFERSVYLLLPALFDSLCLLGGTLQYTKRDTVQKMYLILGHNKKAVQSAKTFYHTVIGYDINAKSSCYFM